MWEVEWWHWAIFGLTLLVLDVLILNIFYLLWFGLAATTTAVLLAISPDMPIWVQILMFTVQSAAFLGLWILLIRPQKSAKSRETAVRELPGQAGIVIHYNEQKQVGTLRLQRPIGGKDVWDFSADFIVRSGDTVVISQLNEDNAVQITPKNETPA